MSNKSQLQLYRLNTALVKENGLIVITRMCTLIKQIYSSSATNCCKRKRDVICFSVRKVIVEALLRLTYGTELLEFHRSFLFIFESLADAPGEIFWIIGDLLSRAKLREQTLDHCLAFLNEQNQLLKKFIAICILANNPYIFALSILIMLEKIASFCQAKILLVSLDTSSFLKTLFNHPLKRRSTRAFLIACSGDDPVLAEISDDLLHPSIHSSEPAVRNCILIFLTALCSHLTRTHSLHILDKDLETKIISSFHSAQLLGKSPSVLLQFFSEQVVHCITIQPIANNFFRTTYLFN